MDKHRSLIVLGAWLIAWLLGGCGDGGDSATAERNNSDDAAAAQIGTAQNAGPAGRSRQGDRWINSLSFEASGDASGRLESDGADLYPAGGCDENGFIRVSINRGDLNDRNMFQLRLVTETAVGPGGTGTYALSELGWYDGLEKVKNLPADMEIWGPDAYEGTGTLVLTTHNSASDARRMIGTVEGTVKQVSGENEASVKAAFDINMACSSAAQNLLRKL